jgi:hypothetical protein
MSLITVRLATLKKVLTGTGSTVQNFQITRAEQASWRGAVPDLT